MLNQIYRIANPILILILLFLFTDLYWEYRQTLKRAEVDHVQFFLMTLYPLIIGILVEWKSLKQLIKGEFQINLLLIPAIIMLILAFIPNIYWTYWFGVGLWYVDILTISQTSVVIDLIAGVLFIRSLT